MPEGALVPDQRSSERVSLEDPFSDRAPYEGASYPPDTVSFLQGAFELINDFDRYHSSRPPFPSS